MRKTMVKRLCRRYSCTAVATGFRSRDVRYAVLA
jgi:hypothetical protein